MEPIENIQKNKVSNSESNSPTLSQVGHSSDDSLPVLDAPNIVLIRKIGEGARGRVYLGKHTLLETDVAVKILQVEPEENKSWTERFLREGQILSKLQHPNIVRLFSYGLSTASVPYIVMEYASGNDLETYIKDNGPLRLEQAIEITKQLVSALTTVHNHGIVHRDIKPGNIMIKENGIPILLDFGISKITSEQSTRLTASSQLIGTPAYMSPEQSKGISVDHLSDQYSLACVFCFMVSGQTLFEANSDMELILKQYQEKPDLARLKLPSDVQRALSRALEKRPEDRFDKLSDFAEQLQSADLARKERVPGVAIVLCLAVGLVLSACILLPFQGQLKKQEPANTEENEKASKNVLSDKQRRIDDEKFRQIAKTYAVGDFEGAKAAAREFLLTPSAKNDASMREKGLGQLAAYLMNGKPESADECLSLLKEQLKILETTSTTHSDYIRQNSIARRFETILKILGAYQCCGRLKEAKDYIDKLKTLIASESFSIDNPANVFETLYFESQYLWSIGKEKDALAADKRVFDAIRGDPFEDAYLDTRRFFTNTADHWTKSRTVSPDCSILGKEVAWWLANRMSAETDLPTILSVYELLAHSGSKKNLETGIKLLQDCLPIVLKEESISAPVKLRFLSSVLQYWNTADELRDKTLDLNQIKSGKKDFLHLLTKETGEKADSRAIVDASIILAKRFIDLGRKSDAVELMMRTNTVVNGIEKFDPSQKIYLLSNVIYCWQAKGEPSIPKDKVLMLSEFVSKTIDEEIKARAINNVSSDTVGMMRDLLVNRECMSQSLKFVQQNFEKVNENASVSIDSKLLFLDQILQSLQKPNSTILSDSEAARLKKTFMDLQSKYKTMKLPSSLDVHGLEEIQKRLSILDRAKEQ